MWWDSAQVVYKNVEQRLKIFNIETKIVKDIFLENRLYIISVISEVKYNYKPRPPISTILLQLFAI